MKRRLWTPQEEQYLREHYAHTLTADIAAALGMAPKRVLAKANAMGLHKSVELISATARARTGADHPSVAYRWGAGHEPWNKGVPGSTGHHPNTRATQFKPGSKPPTWVPVGSFRIVGGALEVKYSDNPGYPRARWKFYGRHLWEQAHGPVPKGHLVVFRPGRASTDPQRITLDDVELITRREIMARNSCHRLLKPVEQAIQLRGQITRAIKRLTQQAREAEEAQA